MKLFAKTFFYRLKTLCTGAFGISFFLLALAVAASPFLGLIIPDAPVPIGWIDEDNTEFSQRLLEGVEELDVVWVTHGDRETLVANLQTGRLEGVFVIKRGFGDAIKRGEFERTLQLLRSPYSTAAGVISESVGSQAMRLWLLCTSANEARAAGGDALYERVFSDVAAGTDKPILGLERKNQAGDTGEVTPVVDAAHTSLGLLCAVGGFFMLTGLALTGRGADFALRLKSRAFSIEAFRMAAGAADAAYMLPCAAPPLVALWIAGEGQSVPWLLAMFAFYMLSFAGLAGVLARIRTQTLLVLGISVLTIANVMLGSLLVKLPQTGVAAYLLPARWMSAADALGAPLCLAGLAASALVYNALPFLLRRKKN